MKETEKERNGVIGRTYEGELPVIWRFVNKAANRQKREALPWLAVISWRYNGAENNEMPPKAVNARMIVLETTIENEVEKNNLCEHAISKTGNNLKELIYYIRNREAFMEQFNLALNAHERFPIEITFCEDREWKEHESARLLFSKSETNGSANPV